MTSGPLRSEMPFIAPSMPSARHSLPGPFVRSTSRRARGRRRRMRSMPTRRLDRANEHRAPCPSLARDGVDAPVHAVDEIHVRDHRADRRAARCAPSFRPPRDRRDRARRRTPRSRRSVPRATPSGCGIREPRRAARARPASVGAIVESNAEAARQTRTPRCGRGVLESCVGASRCLLGSRFLRCRFLRRGALFALAFARRRLGSWRRRAPSRQARLLRCRLAPLLRGQPPWRSAWLPLRPSARSRPASRWWRRRRRCQHRSGDRCTRRLTDDADAQQIGRRRTQDAHRDREGRRRHAVPMPRGAAGRATGAGACAAARSLAQPAPTPARPRPTRATSKSSPRRRRSMMSLSCASLRMRTNMRSLRLSQSRPSNSRAFDERRSREPLRRPTRGRRPCDARDRTLRRA